MSQQKCIKLTVSVIWNINHSLNYYKTNKQYASELSLITNQPELNLTNFSGNVEIPQIWSTFCDSAPNSLVHGKLWSLLFCATDHQLYAHTGVTMKLCDGCGVTDSHSTLQ